VVQGQYGETKKRKKERPHLNQLKKKAEQGGACLSSQVHRKHRMACLGINTRPNLKVKRDVNVAQVVQHLPGKQKALNSNPVPFKKNKNKTECLE
jgi:DNA invertase Pin-like site-specific DNA recombinase